MKKIWIMIAVVISILIMLILPNLIFGVHRDSFDKYKFVEEWYKAFVYIAWSLFLADYCVKKIALYRNEKRIQTFLSDKIKKVDFMLEAIRKGDCSEFLRYLDCFYIEYENSVLDRVLRPYTIFCSDQLIENAKFILENRNEFEFSSEICKDAVRIIEIDSAEYKKKLCSLIRN